MFELSKEESKRIEFTKKQIQESKQILKSEFYGIDKQIDEICDNVLDYITFNKFQRTPLIINLWGMTGCGKTSLVNRLLELLSFDKIYFNFARISEKTSYEVEEYIQIEVLTKKPNDNTNFIVYDEFQYARTIDSKGGEIDRPSMKIFWELLDSGIFSIPFSYSDKYRMKMLYNSFKNIIDNDEIEIEYGEITKGENLWKYIIGNYLGKTKKYYSSEIDDEILEELNLNRGEFESEVIFDFDYINTLLTIFKTKYGKKYKSTNNIIDEIKKFKDKKELFSFIDEAYNILTAGKTTNLSRSCIFVIGNLDEAYQISGDKNPDMSANQFHQYTSGLNTVDIKNALGNRFRNEQISRLGNIHLIYPSFNEESYQKIIKYYLDSYKKDVEKEFNILIDFQNSIYDIIYKDGVFPTQGTRPLFSTISEIIKTKLSHIITHAIENEIKFDKLIYSFEKNTICVSYFNNDEYLDCKCFEQVLRVENERHNSNQNFQMLCAVHETGHALVDLIRFNELPEKLCSVTLESGIGGFLLKEFDKSRVLNKSNLIDTLSVSMAGRAAEEIVFGIDNVSSGASADIRNATNISIAAIRRQGFGDSLAVNDWNGDPMFGKYVFNKEDGDKLALDLINKSYEIAKETLNNQMELLYHISKYLSKRNTISKKTFKKMVKEHYKGELPSVITNTKKVNSQYVELFYKKFEK